MTTSTPPFPAIKVGPYTLRQTTEQDRQHLQDWIEQDPHHPDTNAKWWLYTCPGEDSWALEDKYGKVVFYFKTQTSCRLHIQFGPSNTAELREANRDALVGGMAWLEATLLSHRFREIVFESRNPPLVRTAEKRLGFTRAPDDLRRSLPTATERRRAVGPGPVVPRASEEEV